MATNSISRTRATNLTGLIDIDALVEANTLRQKTKINTATQKLKVEQYKQEQYRAIQKKAKTFYNKYFDVLSGTSLLNSNTYNSMRADSSDSDNVTAKASSSAKSGSYEVKISQPATSRRAEISEDDLNKLQKITVNNIEFELSGNTAKEKAENLNNQLKEKGLNVTATYTDLYSYGDNSSTIKYGGMILKSTVAGKDEELLTVGGAEAAKNISDIKSNADEARYKSISISAENLNNSDVLKLNDEIEVTVKDPKDLNTLVSELNNKIAASDKYKDTIKAEVKEENGKKSLVISRTDFDTDEKSVDLSLKINGNEGNDIQHIDQNVVYHSLKMDINNFKDNNKSLIVNGKAIKFEIDNSDTSKTVENLNKALKNAGIKAEAAYDENSSEFTLNATVAGKDGKFEAAYRDNNNTVAGMNIKAGTDSKVTIKDLTTGQERTYENASSEIQVDGVTFKIDENAKADSTTKITIKSDATDLKKKIVDFINDYNDLIGSINEKLYEARDNSYMPLTDDDKEGLSDSQIDKLEKKAQEGLLRNDSYLRNFADDMKQTMSTVLKDGINKGFNIEKLGIKPVEDYTAQNGLFIVDEDALLSALEENPDGVKELFVGENGIVKNLKENLYDHATGTFSKLANRAGIANGVTASTNEMSKDIEQRKKLISEMQAALKEKEDALYTRYSTLESNLSALQSQQSSLSSYFQ